MINDYYFLFLQGKKRTTIVAVSGRASWSFWTRENVVTQLKLKKFCLCRLFARSFEYRWETQNIRQYWTHVKRSKLHQKTTLMTPAIISNQFQLVLRINFHHHGLHLENDIPITKMKSRIKTKCYRFCRTAKNWATDNKKSWFNLVAQEPFRNAQHRRMPNSLGNSPSIE